MTPLLAVVTVMALLQGAEVTASVDRTHLTVGEEVTLTLRARTPTAPATCSAAFVSVVLRVQAVGSVVPSAQACARMAVGLVP